MSTSRAPKYNIFTCTMDQVPSSAEARFSKVRKMFWARKAFVKLRTVYSVKLVFSYVVKGIKITVKFYTSRCLRFKDTKRILSHEMRPKSFGTFEKQAPGQSFNLCSSVGSFP